jgi:hypothetical protein
VLALDAQTVVDLPVDQLGLAILGDFVATGGWNERNYILEARQYGGFRDEASRAISEAFGWLRARGLTAIDPDQSCAGAP